ncbi:MAG: 2'-5' RNA ligase family protein [Candidatus Micrarchaeota archaeon]
MEAMRLFAALFPPEEIVQDLLSFREKMLSSYSPPPIHEENRIGPDGSLRRPSSAWRSSPRPQLHITLQFIGDLITVHQASQIKEALRAAATGGQEEKEALQPPAPHGQNENEASRPSDSPLNIIRPFSIECVGVGAFPSPSRASVIWAGVRGEGLERLAGAIGASLAPIGFPPDRPFHSHITLLRSKFAQDARALIAPFENARWSARPWRADSFSLMDSREVLGGHEHEELARYPLKQD